MRRIAKREVRGAQKTPAMRPFHSHRPTTSCGLRPGNRRAKSGIIFSITFMLRHELLVPYDVQPWDLRGLRQGPALLTTIKVGNGLTC
jgi:hypothetical protein